MNKHGWLTAFLAAAVIACTAPAESDAGKPYLIVLNTLSESISVLTDKDILQKSAALTGASPNDMLLYDGKIYVLNSLSNSVTVYDKNTLKLLREFSVGSGTNPYRMLVLNGNLWITAYTAHQVLVVDTDGNPITQIRLDNAGQYYPYPEGIATDGKKIYVACKDSMDQTAATCSKDGGRVAVINAADYAVECYIAAGAADTSDVFVSGDRLYIVNSGVYISADGFNETGTIASVALSDISGAEIVKPVVHASGNSFGVCRIYQNVAFCGNLGNGKLIKYETDGLQWRFCAEREFDGDGSLAFVSGLAYDEEKNVLWVTEYNGKKLYKIDPATLNILADYKTSDETLKGDTLGVMIIGGG